VPKGYLSEPNQFVLFPPRHVRVLINIRKYHPSPRYDFLKPDSRGPS